MTPQVSSTAESGVLTVFPNNQWTGATYDAAGNQKSIGGVLTQNQYDVENRMVLITGQSGTASQYAYDGEGRRVERVVGGETSGTFTTQTATWPRSMAQRRQAERSSQWKITWAAFAGC